MAYIMEPKIIRDRILRPTTSTRPERATLDPDEAGPGRSRRDGPRGALLSGPARSPLSEVTERLGDHAAW